MPFCFHVIVCVIRDDKIQVWHIAFCVTCGIERDAVYCSERQRFQSVHNIEIIRRCRERGIEAEKHLSAGTARDFIISALSPPLAALLIMDQNTRHALGTRERKHLSIYTCIMPLCFCSQDAAPERDAIFISSGGAFKGSEREIKQHIIHPAQAFISARKSQQTPTNTQVICRLPLFGARSHYILT
jgi:hypothetical protein